MHKLIGRHEHDEERERGLWSIMAGGWTHVDLLSSSSDACRLHSEIVALSRSAIRSNDEITFIAFSSDVLDPWETEHCIPEVVPLLRYLIFEWLGRRVS